MDRKDQLFVINEVSVNLFTSSTLGPACNEQFDAQKCAGSSPVLGITELVVRGSGGGGGSSAPKAFQKLEMSLSSIHLCDTSMRLDLLCSQLFARGSRVFVVTGTWCTLLET